MVKLLVKIISLFSLLDHLNFTTRDSFAKFQNVTKGTADATLKYLLCGFVGHFKIKYMFYNARGGGGEGEGGI